jgi:DNA-binding response OmpR family regulator
MCFSPGPVTLFAGAPEVPMTCATLGPADTCDSPRVLIADDAQDDREMYAMFLRNVAGYAVTEAGSGHEALDLLARARPHVVILDVMLPGIDGIAVCEQLRASAGTDYTAVVTVTALPAESPGVQRMIEAGTDAVLIKPCPPQALLDAIAQLLDRGRLLQQLSLSQRQRAAMLRVQSDLLHERTLRNFAASRELVAQAELLKLSRRIRDTYQERDDLSLTVHQATRLWGFDESTCQRAFDGLRAEGFLTRKPDGSYQRP